MSDLNQRRCVYLLPNLLTTANLFMAFYAIIASMQHRFEEAIIAIFIGMIADSLDGRVARMTNTQSAFGVQYDSLSDMVSFGVAPSIAAFSWMLINLGKFGWLAAFFYTASVALRLARFNVQAEVADKRYFIGLPCPAGAGVIASIIWFAHNQGYHAPSFSLPMAGVMMVIAVLMVSNVRFYSFKEFDFKEKAPSRYVLLTVLVFMGVAAYPSLVLLVSFCLYALSGPLYSLIRQCRLRKKRGRRTKK